MRGEASCENSMHAGGRRQAAGMHTYRLPCPFHEESNLLRQERAIPESVPAYPSDVSSLSLQSFNSYNRSPNGMEYFGKLERYVACVVLKTAHAVRVLITVRILFCKQQTAETSPSNNCPPTTPPIYSNLQPNALSTYRPPQPCSQAENMKTGLGCLHRHGRGSIAEEEEAIVAKCLLLEAFPLCPSNFPISGDVYGWSQLAKLATMNWIPILLLPQNLRPWERQQTHAAPHASWPLPWWNHRNFFCLVGGCGWNTALKSDTNAPTATQRQHPTNDIRHGLSCSNLAGDPEDHGDLGQPTTSKSRMDTEYSLSQSRMLVRRHGGWSSQPIEPVPGTCLFVTYNTAATKPPDPGPCRPHAPGSFSLGFNHLKHGIRQYSQPSSTLQQRVALRCTNTTDEWPTVRCRDPTMRKISVAPTASPGPRIAPQRRCLRILVVSIPHIPEPDIRSNEDARPQLPQFPSLRSLVERWEDRRTTGGYMPRRTRPADPTNRLPSPSRAAPPIQVSQWRWALHGQHPLLGGNPIAPKPLGAISTYILTADTNFAHNLTAALTSNLETPPARPSGLDLESLSSLRLSPSAVCDLMANMWMPILRSCYLKLPPTQRDMTLDGPLTFHAQVQTTDTQNTYNCTDTGPCSRARAPPPVPDTAEEQDRMRIQILGNLTLRAANFSLIALFWRAKGGQKILPESMESMRAKRRGVSAHPELSRKKKRVLPEYTDFSTNPLSHETSTPSKPILSPREEQSGREMGLAEKRNPQNPWVDRGSWTLAFYGVVGRGTHMRLTAGNTFAPSKDQKKKEKRVRRAPNDNASKWERLPWSPYQWLLWENLVHTPGLCIPATLQKSQGNQASHKSGAEGILAGVPHLKLGLVQLFGSSLQVVLVRGRHRTRAIGGGIHFDETKMIQAGRQAAVTISIPSPSATHSCLDPILNTHVMIEILVEAKSSRLGTSAKSRGRRLTHVVDADELVAGRLRRDS
ncbi:uncharacterized protein CLUP02_00934 [Colletotrichum lupini]|uniref:Uncharacterized protein n=1 Tax=Colletotrichum lupini TaxID=145971 RepID=A0A9Q8W8T6_9PEZI|nr:uncharacterized protein CLUP02_00934 [Colletotrichum lupini]UQC74286.1 hypothetical protein CLUP02_00934 [Colletotrichum lupini]